MKNIYNYHWIKYNIIITQLETKLPNSQWQIGKEKILLFSFDCHTESTYKMFNNNKFIKTYVTSLENADTTNSNIGFNGYKLYVNGTAINKKMHCKDAFFYILGIYS